MISISDIPAPGRPVAGRIRLDSDPAGDRRLSRWSYFPAAPVLVLRVAADGSAEAHSADGVIQRWPEPLAALAWAAGLLSLPPAEGPPFKGGWVGCYSYDLGRSFEQIPATAAMDSTFPLVHLTYHDRVVAADHATGRWFEIHHATPFSGRPVEGWDRPTAFALAGPSAATSGGFTRESYERAVVRAIEYIAAGDIFQVNLSQRFNVPLRESPPDIYQRLVSRTPAWFGAYMDLGQHAVLSNSPELFLRVTPTPGGRRILTRPIKGTRPRGAGMERELLDSIKDQAELNMIIDLERNDLGRVCRIGSVRVNEPRRIEAHPTVYHGVAGIQGTLRDDVGLVELLAATFPGGSITGAPKIRAMQIIEELEPTRRGPYCGAIGYLSADGHISLNIAIRTMLVEAASVRAQVGGGIVADSLPADEYEETLVKAQAMMAALGACPGRIST